MQTQTQRRLGSEVDEELVATIVKNPLGLLARIVELAIAAAPVEVSVAGEGKGC